MPRKNKVKFNIKNVHYAKLNKDVETGAISFDTPVAMPGAVSLSLDPNGEPSVFYADGYAYYTISNNQGYEGDLELAMVPESFRTDILKESLDNNNVLVEDATVETESFALLFEFDGDVNQIRHVLYNCTASRPGIESATNEDEIEVKTETLSLKAAPLSGGYVKARTSDTTSKTAYDNWYSAVYLPNTGTGTDLASLAIGSLTLSPAFAAGTSLYTATTSNATNTVSATAAESGATVDIKVNNESHTSGQSATWESGTNTVVVTVTNEGSVKTYTVIVTKTAG